MSNPRSVTDALDRINAARSAEKPATPTYKEYHTTIPNSSYYDAAGQQHSFVGRLMQVPLENTELIAALDAIADKPGCPIFTKAPVEDPAVARAQTEVRNQAESATAALAAAQQAVARGVPSNVAGV